MREALWPGSFTKVLMTLPNEAVSKVGTIDGRRSVIGGAECEEAFV
jgi:hypothetical protein